MDVFGVDWHDVFWSEMSLLETSVRATILYFFVFFIMRSTLRRSAGELSMLDFIFVLLVANGAADSMTGGSISIVSGIVTILTIVFWNYSLNLVGFYVPFVDRLISPQPLLVIKDGEMMRRNMRREFLTEQELRGQLREQGVEDISKVKSAYLEGDGNVSVIPYEE